MSSITCLLRQQGVVMLRGVLEHRCCRLSTLICAFVRGLGQQPNGDAWLDNDDRHRRMGDTVKQSGSWHQPWVVRHWLQRRRFDNFEPLSLRGPAAGRAYVRVHR